MVINWPVIRIYLHLAASSVYVNFILYLASLLLKWKTYTPNQLAQALWLKNKRSACHILGSGQTLPLSLRTIDENSDLVIGLNFSGLAYSKADVYFIEIASSNTKDHKFQVSEAQHILWKHLKKTNPDTKFIFKNIWEKKNSLIKINALYGKDLYFLKDAVAKANNDTSIDKLIDIILSKTHPFPNQAQTISTIITAIAIAYKAGFKEIILHGVDLTGPSFYEATDSKDRYLTEVVDKITNKTPSHKNQPHKTNTEKITHSHALLVIREKLNSKGVILRAALPNSNLGKLFQNNEHTNRPLKKS